ncbi:MAG: glycine cleavage system protein GcvH [Phycisphaerae bacterium]|nr:glycine cleavage system protein GcvH [Phycisphaerae bacterium]
MDVPADRKYTKSHEWHKLQDDLVVIGISEHAVTELTDITYVDLPKPGTKVTAGEPFGEIESVKATSELFSGISGEVTQVNETLASDPGLLNRDPYDSGWLIKVRPLDISELDKLMPAEAYQGTLA